MLIECPSCSAKYEVPERLAAGSRIVRCAKCLREWTIGEGRVGAPHVLSAAEPMAGPDSAELRPAPEESPPVREPRPFPPASVFTAQAWAEPELPAAPQPEEPLPPSPPPRPTAPPLTAARPVRRPSPFARLMAQSEGPRVGAALWASWVVSILAVLLLCWAAYAWRSDLMAAWPPSQRLYAALGLKNPPP